jgi:hypothetical protein
MGHAGVRWRDPCQGHPPAVSLSGSSRFSFPARRRCRSCLLLVAVGGARPHGGWRSSAIARLQGFSSCSPAVISRQWPSTRMTTSLVVEKRAGLRPPPCPQLQGCSSSSLGWKASRVGVLPSAWAGDPLLPPPFGGEGCSPALQRRRTSATRGWPAAGAVSCRVSSSLAWMALPPLPVPPAAAKRGAAVRPPHGRRLRRAQVCRIRGALLRRCPGGRTRLRMPRRWRPRSWMVLSSLRRRAGARTSSCAAGATAVAGAEVATVVGAEVVAAAGEAARCRGGCLRWQDHQHHLPPSLQLFGFNGLVAAPHWKTGARTSSQWRS